MSRDAVLAELVSLGRMNPRSERLNSLLHRLDVYEVELEMQNVELRNSQRVLEESRDRYANLYDFVPQGFLTLDLMGCICEINLTAATLIGVERAALIGNFLHHFLSPDDRAVLHRHLQQCNQRHFPYLSSELTILRNDLPALPVQLLSSTVPAPVEGEGRRHRRFRTAIVDLSERRLIDEERVRLLELEKRARAEAEMASEAKDDFLAMVSHELRTPLQPILSYAGLLKQGRLSSEMTAKALQAIERNAHAQARIIDDLLDVSRVISGKLTLDRRPVDLKTMLESMVESFSPAFANAKVKLVSQLESEPCLMQGDLSRLQQIIANLLSNALKFTHAEGSVTLRLRKYDDKAVIEVEDTGRGIPADFLPHIFERFRQADTGPSRSTGGLGLGLAIARHIVERHDGSISAASRGEGKGALLTVTLPLSALPETRAAIAPPARERPPSAKFPDLDGIRILVVDDEIDARESIVSVLKACHAETRAASSAAEALKRIHEAQPDVLVADIGMPLEDGYSLISRVRSLEPQEGGRMPAIALTAFASPEDELKVLRAGFQAHLPKPIDPGTLAKTISIVSKVLR